MRLQDPDDRVRIAPQVVVVRTDVRNLQQVNELSDDRVLVLLPPLARGSRGRTFLSSQREGDKRADSKREEGLHRSGDPRSHRTPAAQIFARIVLETLRMAGWPVTSIV